MAASREERLIPAGWWRSYMICLDFLDLIDGLADSYANILLAYSNAGAHGIEQSRKEFIRGARWWHE
jgi:hypothetical protein